MKPFAARDMMTAVAATKSSAWSLGNSGLHASGNVVMPPPFIKKLVGCSILISSLFGMDALAYTPEEADAAKTANTLETEVLQSQVALAEAQQRKVAADKALVDAQYPPLTGGKAGSFTFDPNTDVGVLAQPASVVALNKTADTVCEKVASATKTPPAGLVLIGGNDALYMAQASIVTSEMQLLANAYDETFPKLAKVPKAKPEKPDVSVFGFSTGVGGSLYQAGSILKEVAGFTQLFRNNTTILNATVTVDQPMLDNAIAGCLKSPTSTTKGLVAAYVVAKSGPFFAGWKKLTEDRAKAEQMLSLLADNKDPQAKAGVATLTMLNRAMDALFATIFSDASGKGTESSLIALLKGDALNQYVANKGLLLEARLASARAAGVKTESLWYSDRLYAWASVSVNYTLYGQDGTVLTAGTTANQAEPTKIVVGR